MNQVRIASIVEGHGEVLAIPVLLRRIVNAIDPQLLPVSAKPFRHPSGTILKVKGLERAIEAVAGLYPGHAILTLIDSDDDCPRDLVHELTLRAQQARPDLTISVVLAHREFEAWFLAGAESLAGERNLKVGLTAPDQPEDIRNAKGWLTQHMAGKGRYSPTQDQPAFAQLLDLALVRNRSRSFRKLWKEVERMIH